MKDYEREEMLYKALRKTRMDIQRPKRKLRQPAMETLAKRVTDVFDRQMRQMVKRIAAVIE